MHAPRLRILLAVASTLTAGLVLTACVATDPEPSVPPASASPSAAPAPSLALADLLTADVPALCDHPAGTLVDGALPGIAELAGSAGLPSVLIDELHSGAESSEYALIGSDLDEQPFLAAIMHCDMGGVSWPNTVVVYDADMTPVAEFHPEDLTGGDREQIAGITATDAGFQARWTATNEYDAACCGQLSVQADVTVSLADAAATAATPTLLRGEEQLRAVSEAALAGTTVDGTEVAEGLYDGILSIQQKGGVYDLDGIVCDDTDSSPVGTIICGIPVTMDGDDLAFVVYPALNGAWNAYDFPQFEYELW